MTRFRQHLFRRVAQAILVALIGFGSVRFGGSAPDQAPYYRVQMLDEFRSLFNSMMLNNRNALAILQPDDETLRFLFRGRHRTADIVAPLDSRITDVNIHGTTVFWANYAGYIYRRGTLINLTNLLPYVYFNSLGINGRGHIVGGAQLQPGPPITAFSYYRGRHRMFEPLIPGATALAIDVNNHGEIVGAAQYDTNQPASPSSYHAVIFKNGKAWDLGTLPGGTFSVATRINNRGTIVGYSDIINGNATAFFYHNGVMRPVPALPGDYLVVASDVNDKNQIVGYSEEGETSRAILFQDDQTYDLNDLISVEDPLHLVRADSINNRGIILAEGRYGDVVLLFPSKRPVAPSNAQ